MDSEVLFFISIFSYHYFFFLYDTHLWVKATHYLKKMEYSLLFFDYKMEYSLLFFDYKMEYPLLFFDYFSLITKWNTHCLSLITILQYVELCLRKKKLITILQYVKLCLKKKLCFLEIVIVFL